MSSGDGSGWVHCSCGQRHWGKYGAAGLLLTRQTLSGHCEVLLQHRAAWTHHGGTWGFPSGALDRHESVYQAALREAHEELQIPHTAVQICSQRITTSHDQWHFTIVLAQLRHPVALRHNDESLAATWVPANPKPPLPLHPALTTEWQELMDWALTILS